MRRCTFERFVNFISLINSLFIFHVQVYVFIFENKYFIQVCLLDLREEKCCRKSLPYSVPLLGLLNNIPNRSVNGAHQTACEPSFE